MSNNRTIVTPGRPKFGLYEITYCRSSATKGYVEPLQIVDIAFDNGSNTYLYSFSRDAGVPSGLRLPTRLLEHELLTLCEALDLQIAFLTKKYNDATAQFTASCSESQEQPSVTPSDEDRQIRYPAAPRFGVNQVVYLKDTAESVGRLESYRINWLRFDAGLDQWIYKFHLRKPPGGTMTVGERDDMRRSVELEYAESELLSLCEALPLVVSFLETALQNAMARRQALCESS